jgi:serine/threonine protein phosphatase 1
MKKTFVIGDVHGRHEQLERLLGMLPRDETSDTLVFLGDLIDRGPDAPGVVSDVMSIVNQHPDKVVCMLGNHEQMLLDFLDTGAPLWLSHATGGEFTYEQYTGESIWINTEEDYEKARQRISSKLPEEHVQFFRERPFFYEDAHAIYVHAGLDNHKHPRDTDPHTLLWTRDRQFYTQYRGKPCIFGHTPTPFLPLRGRLGRHGIYISHSAIGIDTGYSPQSPLSSLVLPDFTLYQAFADGHTATHQIKSFIPEELSAFRATSD